MPDTPAILFVCMGNICRSPMAEGAFLAAAQTRNIAVRTDSAGTGGWHKGEPPDRRAQQMAARHGVDISHQQARQVQPADFDQFDHIVAMDADNLVNLKAMQPAGSRALLSLMLDHAQGRAGQSVPDPYYGGPQGFETVWLDVTAGAEGLLDKLGR